MVHSQHSASNPHMHRHILVADILIRQFARFQLHVKLSCQSRKIGALRPVKILCYNSQIALLYRAGYPSFAPSIENSTSSLSGWNLTIIASSVSSPSAVHNQNPINQVRSSPHKELDQLAAQQISNSHEYNLESPDVAVYLSALSNKKKKTLLTESRIPVLAA